MSDLESLAAIGKTMKALVDFLITRNEVNRKRLARRLADIIKLLDAIEADVKNRKIPREHSYELARPRSS